MKFKLVSLSLIFLLSGLMTVKGQNEGDAFDDQDFYDQVTASFDMADSTIDLTNDFLAGERLSQRDSIMAMDTALFVVYGIVTFFGLIGNIIVFFIIIAGNEIGKTVTTIYVLQLTIADTIFLLTLPIFSAQKLNAFNNWNFGGGMCTISQTIKYWNYYAGMFFLTAMSVDRYIAISYNSKLSQIRTKGKTYIICGLVWIMACIMSIPVMLYARIETFSGMTHCRVMFPGYTENRNSTVILSSEEGDDIGFLFNYEDYDNGSFEDTQSNSDYFDEKNYTWPSYYCQFEYQSQMYKTWLVFDAFVAFIIPFSVIVLMYSLIMIRMRRVEHNVAHIRSRRLNNNRVTKMVAALVSCFAICWLPHHILTIARIPGFLSSVMTCHGLEEFFTALAFSNSALNPMLYTFLGFKFKERFKTSARNMRSIVKRRGSRQSYHRASRNNFGEEVTKRDTSVV